MPSIFTDQLHRTITVAQPPQRIVSLVPSQTELLYTLGLQEEVVGITKFCIHPEEWFHSKTRVGGTKKLNLERIQFLHPDLIIGNQEENEQQQIEALAAHFPVWMSKIDTLPDAMQMIQAVGNMVNREEEAQVLVESIQSDFKKLLRPTRLIRAAYLIWKEPYMVAAKDTFINEMLQRACFYNVFADQSRYSEITLEALAKAQPEVILLSSEPYPFEERHIRTFQQVCQRAVVQVVDGELFSWYGSRLLHSAMYFRTLHGEISAQLKKKVG